MYIVKRKVGRKKSAGTLRRSFHNSYCVNNLSGSERESHIELSGFRSRSAIDEQKGKSTQTKQRIRSRLGN
jgi:hypothetical protein